MGQDDYDRRIKEQAVLLPPYTPKTRREQEIAAQKERANAAEAQLKQIRDDYHTLQKEVQNIRERMAAIEGKKKEE